MTRRGPKGQIKDGIDELRRALNGLVRLLETPPAPPVVVEPPREDWGAAAFVVALAALAVAVASVLT